MENPLENNCNPNRHYSKVEASRMLGISRPTLDKYISQGRIGIVLHTPSSSVRIKGKELIRYYNSIS